MLQKALLASQSAAAAAPKKAAAVGKSKAQSRNTPKPSMLRQLLSGHGSSGGAGAPSFGGGTGAAGASSSFKGGAGAASSSFKGGAAAAGASSSFGNPTTNSFVAGAKAGAAPNNPFLNPRPAAGTTMDNPFAAVVANHQRRLGGTNATGASANGLLGGVGANNTSLQNPPGGGGHPSGGGGTSGANGNAGGLTAANFGSL